MKPTIEQLLKDIDAFLERHALSDTYFGLYAMNDRHLVRRLRAGGDLKTRTVDRLRSYMDREDTKLARAKKRKAVAAKRKTSRLGKKRISCS